MARRIRARAKRDAVNNAWAKFQSWQWWLGILACGLCGGVGGYLGQLQGYPALGAALGGGIGGVLLLRLRRHLRAAD